MFGDDTACIADYGFYVYCLISSLFVKHNSPYIFTLTGLCGSRCLLHSLSAVSGAVWHSFVPPGDFTWTVHQSGRGQCLEGHLPIIWRYSFYIFWSVGSSSLESHNDIFTSHSFVLFVPFCCFTQSFDIQGYMWSYVVFKASTKN